MKQVTKEEFYAAIGRRDIHGTIVTRYPYTTEFRDQRTQKHVGRTVDAYPPDGVWPLIESFFIDEEALASIPEIK